MCFKIKDFEGQPKQLILPFNELVYLCTRSICSGKTSILGHVVSASLVGMEILGHLPSADQWNGYVLVALDYFTKWPEAYEIPNQSAASTAGQRDVLPLWCTRGAAQ